MFNHFIKIIRFIFYKSKLSFFFFFLGSVLHSKFTKFYIHNNNINRKFRKFVYTRTKYSFKFLSRTTFARSFVRPLIWRFGSSSVLSLSFTLLLSLSFFSFILTFFLAFKITLSICNWIDLVKFFFCFGIFFYVLLKKTTTTTKNQMNLYGLWMNYNKKNDQEMDTRLATALKKWCGLKIVGNRIVNGIERKVFEWVSEWVCSCMCVLYKVYVWGGNINSISVENVKKLWHSLSSNAIFFLLFQIRF